MLCCDMTRLMLVDTASVHAAGATIESKSLSIPGRASLKVGCTVFFEHVRRHHCCRFVQRD